MKMKITNISLIMFLFFASCTKQEINEKASIRINQLGYYPQSVKKAVVADSNTNEFEIRRSDNTVAFTGKLSESKFYDKSGENLKTADFSELKDEGSYYFYVADSKDSCAFEIKTNLYAQAYKAALKSYYFQRCSHELKEEHAGIYKRPAGHPDTFCIYHPSAQNGEGNMKSVGGWYDAGDYNKYVVNAGVSVGTILNFEEMYPNFTGDALNIPESGNNISDLLDEIRFEMDWMVTMQAPDGGSYFKLTAKSFDGFVMPHKSNDQRYIVGKSTASTLNLCAATAQTARLYKNIDTAFAAKCLQMAESAWRWANENPNIVFKNPEDIVTGEYSDVDFAQEFWWAAAELYATTQDSIYLNYLKNNQPYMKMEVGESWRSFVGNLGGFSIIVNENILDKELVETMKKLIVGLADDLISKIEQNPYRTFLDEYVWGSNSDILNSAMVLCYAHKITGEPKYLNFAIETTDYILGKNATGYSLLTGFGQKRVMNLHHRPSGGDGIAEPVPGFVSGGPNFGRNDRTYVKYVDTLPAKSFMDVEGSYASNEVAINWNAPAVFVLGYIEANMNKK